MAETPTLPHLRQPAFSASRDVATFTYTAATDMAHPKGLSAKRHWTGRATVLALIIAIAANLAIVAVIAGRDDFGSASPTPPPVRTLPLVRPMPLALSAPSAPAAPLAPSAPTGTLATTFGEGKFVIGRDIAPGTYRTTGKSGHPDCYWERLKDAGGTTASIIANDLAPGPATVTIDNTDATFQTRWCNTWTRVS